MKGGLRRGIGGVQLYTVQHAQQCLSNQPGGGGVERVCDSQPAPLGLLAVHETAGAWCSVLEPGLLGDWLRSCLRVVACCLTDWIW